MKDLQSKLLLVKKDENHRTPLQYRPKHLSDRIMLNISGSVYETRIRTLERFPHTLLGDQNMRLRYYCHKTKEYYFERNRLFFDAILFFYQSNGILQCPDQIPVDLFEEECRYFMMPEEAIDRLKRPKDDLLKLDDDEESLGNEDHSIRGKIWNLVANPETSTPAKYFAIFSLIVIAISVAASCLETVPALMSDDNTLQGNPWAFMELILNSWFLLELTTGAVCSPSKKEFFTDIMTWFDMVAILPYFVALAASSKGVNSSPSFLRIARMVRVARLLRLSKQSVRVKLVVKVLKSSAAEFKALLMCILIVVVFGGSLMYYIEVGVDGTFFTDIPLGMYWGIQTITTVGYGDIHPLSAGGKLFASAFMTFGAMTLTIPVLTIITKFVAAYEENHLSC